MSISQVREEFLSKHLPKELLNEIDLKSISIEKTDFISKALKKNASDCLLKAKIKGDDGFILHLVEHQSSIDMMMPFRILQYMVLIWKKYLKDNPGKTKLPLIYPIVISNAKNAHKMPVNISDLFEDNHKELSEKYLLSYKLIDLLSMSDEQIDIDNWSSFMELSLKYKQMYDMMNILKNLADKMKFLINEKGEEGTDLIEALIVYSSNMLNPEDEDDIIYVLEELLEDRGRDMARSLADKWQEEAEARGEARGFRVARFKSAKNMLSDNLDVKIIEKYTGLSATEIAQMKSGEIDPDNAA